MTEILNWLYVGGFNDASNENFLRENKIGAIVNVASSLYDMKYPDFIPKESILKIPIEDHENQVLVGIDMVHIYLKCHKDLKTNVLVHCVAGISRSVSYIAYFMMKELDLPFEEIFTMIKIKRKQANPNPGFVRFLKSVKTGNDEIDFMTLI